TPMRADGRRGQPQMESDVERTLGKAASQIETTARLIAEQHRAFAFVPRDRPMLGMIVTLDSYYVIEHPIPNISTWLASSRDLEQLVTMQDPTIGQFLLSHHNGHHAALLGAELHNAKLGRNSILDHAWNRLPFNPESFQPGRTR